MNQRYIAKSSIIINKPKAVVWDALVNPAIIKQYMFGTNVVTDWKEGSPILWKGEWQGKTYEDKGTILQVLPEKILKYSHFSPLSGAPDTPENYHTVAIELTDEKEGVLVTLSQDNNPTEQAREHAEKNWAAMLDSLKKVLQGEQ